MLPLPWSSRAGITFEHVQRPDVSDRGPAELVDSSKGPEGPTTVTVRALFAVRLCGSVLPQTVTRTTSPITTAATRAKPTNFP
jgi:hypothetical protein